jgi:hypothetical protein
MAFDRSVAAIGLKGLISAARAFASECQVGRPTELERSIRSSGRGAIHGHGRGTRARRAVVGARRGDRVGAATGVVHVRGGHRSQAPWALQIAATQRLAAPPGKDRPAGEDGAERRWGGARPHARDPWVGRSPQPAASAVNRRKY